MKRLFSIILAVAAVLQLAACGDLSGSDTAGVNLSDGNGSSQSSSTDGTSSNGGTDSDSRPNFDGVNSYEDIIDRIDDKFDVIEREDEDGNLVVDLVVPNPDPKPQPNPDKNGNENEDDGNNGGVAIPDLDKVQPQPEPEPEPEPEPQPQPEPEPEPEPQPQPKPEPKPQPKPTESQNPTYTYTTGQKHKEVGTFDRYLYNLLDAEKQSWYREIDKVVKVLGDRARFENTVISENRNYYVYFIYMFDNPEHFYLGNTMTLYNCGDGSSEIAFCYSDGQNYNSYGHNPDHLTAELKASILEKKAVFDAEVERIISTIPANAPDVWKERLIYDRILMDSHYNLGAKWNGICEPNWNAYGILVNKYGVCESYSEAFQLLCLKVGINATGVVGDAGGGHKWNAVQLDGQWYICDITFDDPIGGEQGAAYHYYFNRTTAEMEEMHHSTENSDYPGPNATATKYSFQNYFGENYYG